MPEQLGFFLRRPDFHPFTEGVSASAAKFTLVRQEIRGKPRLICKPNREMAVIHKRLRDFLRKRDPGLVTNRLSSIWNAYLHLGNTHFFQLDIRSAFQRVDLGKLAHLLSRIKGPPKGLPEEWAVFLERYCRDPRGGLATGSHSSPDLFEIYCREFVDGPIWLLCREHGLRYSRYVDDLTFSASQIITRTFRKKIRKILEDAGMPINDRKVFISKLSVGPVTITGYTLTRKRTVSLPKPFLDKATDLLFLNERGEMQDESNRNILSGVIARLRSVERYASQRVDYLQSKAEDVRPVPRVKSRAKIFPESWLQVLLDAGNDRIVEIVGEHLPLRRRGPNFVGLCPFHRDRTASFVVAPYKGFYHCFGCGAHGDTLNFLQQMHPELQDFRRAVIDLGQRVGYLAPPSVRRIIEQRDVGQENGLPYETS